MITSEESIWSYLLRMDWGKLSHMARSKSSRHIPLDIFKIPNIVVIHLSCVVVI